MRFRYLMQSIMVAAIILAAGCGRVQTIRYVPNIEFYPEAAHDLPLDQVYVDPEVSRLKGARVLVQVENPMKTIDREFSKINPKLDTKENWDGLRSLLELGFTVSLKNYKTFGDVQRATYALDSFKPDAILKIAVTEWHEGNKFMRAIFGFGAGHTRVQYEGMLTDARTGKVLFAFADARIHPGGPSALGLPLKVWRGADLIAEDLDWGGMNLAIALRRVIDREYDNGGAAMAREPQPAAERQKYVNQPQPEPRARPFPPPVPRNSSR